MVAAVLSGKRCQIAMEQVFHECAIVVLRVYFWRLRNLVHAPGAATLSRLAAITNSWLRIPPRKRLWTNHSKSSRSLESPQVESVVWLSRHTQTIAETLSLSESRRVKELE